MESPGQSPGEVEDSVHPCQTTEDHYQYLFLPGPDAIRLLILYPSHGFDDPIICSMKTIYSPSSMEYTALSYTWGMNANGDDSFNRQVIIDGRAKPITQNLFEGLRRIRHGLQNESLPMWIDAVCINQADSDERNTQVANMAEIFGSASKVIAWLGEGESSEEDEAVSAILKCCAQGRTGSHNDCRCSWTSSSGEAMNMCAISLEGRWYVDATEGELKVQEDVVRKLRSFLSRRYFTRRWIVQELLHPSMERIQLCWGPVKFSAHRFRTTLDQMTQYIAGVAEWHIYEPELLGEFGEDVYHLRQLMLHTGNRLPMIGGRHAFQSLPHALVLCSALQCVDPRDRLYALLSLDRSFNIRPDYGLSTDAVYVRFARSLVEQGYISNLFGFLKDQNTDLGSAQLPSWVPDLRFRWSNDLLDLLDEEEMKDLNATVDENNILTFRPYYVGTVSKCMSFDDRSFLWIQSRSPQRVGELAEDPLPPRYMALQDQDPLDDQNINTAMIVHFRRLEMLKAHGRHDCLGPSNARLGDIVCRTSSQPKTSLSISMLLRKSQIYPDLHYFVQVSEYNKSSGDVEPDEVGRDLELNPWVQVVDQPRITVRCM